MTSQITHCVPVLVAVLVANAQEQLKAQEERRIIEFQDELERKQTEKVESGGRWN